MSLFSAVEMAPRDPILGLNEQFAADTNPNKVNLGVGVYFDNEGKIPLLECVKAAERQLVEAPKPRGYLPIDGIVAYDNAVKGLEFGADSEPVTSGRVATVQAIGGTGGLKVGADFLRRIDPGSIGVVLSHADRDHDGASPWFAGGDCDDARPGVSPLLLETCQHSVPFPKAFRLAEDWVSRHNFRDALGAFRL